MADADIGFEKIACRAQPDCVFGEQFSHAAVALREEVMLARLDAHNTPDLGSAKRNADRKADSLTVEVGALELTWRGAVSGCDGKVCALACLAATEYLKSVEL